MKLNTGEIKVFYKADTHNGINKELEEDIEKVFKKHGYIRWASGMNIKEGVRDIAFDKEL